MDGQARAHGTDRAHDRHQRARPAMKCMSAHRADGLSSEGRVIASANPDVEDGTNTAKAGGMQRLRGERRAGDQDHQHNGDEDIARRAHRRVRARDRPHAALSFGPSARIKKQVAEGEPNDVTIATDKGIDDSIAQGRIVARQPRRPRTLGHGAGGAEGRDEGRHLVGGEIQGGACWPRSRSA